MLWKNNRRLRKPTDGHGIRLLWRGIPMLPGVYLIFSEDLKVVYVGMSTNLQYRIRGHGAKNQPYRDAVRDGRFTFLVTRTKERAMELEGKVQQRFPNGHTSWPNIPNNKGRPTIPDKDRRKHLVSFKVDEQELLALNQAAADEGITRSELLRRLFA